MSSRTRVLSVTAGVVVVLLAMYFIMIKARTGDLAKTQAAVAAEQSNTSTLQFQLDQLLALEKTADQLEAQIEEARQAIPKANRVGRFIKQLRQAADEAGVTFVDIGPELPKPPPEGAPVAQVRIALGASGEFFSIMDFVRRIYDVERAVRIDLLTLDSGTDSSGQKTVTLTATARIFFELPGSSSIPVPEGSSPTGDGSSTNESS